MLPRRITPYKEEGLVSSFALTRALFGRLSKKSYIKNQYIKIRFRVLPSVSSFGGTIVWGSFYLAYIFLDSFSAFPCVISGVIESTLCIAMHFVGLYGLDAVPHSFMPNGISMVCACACVVDLLLRMNNVMVNAWSVHRLCVNPGILHHVFRNGDSSVFNGLVACLFTDLITI